MFVRILNITLFSGERYHDVRGEAGGSESASQHGVGDEGGHGEAEGDEGGEGARADKGENQAEDRDPGLCGEDSKEDASKIRIVEGILT